MLDKLLSTLTFRSAQQESTLYARKLELAKFVADQPDDLAEDRLEELATEVAARIAELKMSQEELNSMVRTIKERRHLRKQVEAGEQAAVQIVAIESEWTRLMAEREAMLVSFDRQLEAVAANKPYLNTLKMTGEEVRRQLVMRCGNREILAREKEIETQRAEAVATRDRLSDFITTRSNTIRYNQGLLDKFKTANPVQTKSVINAQQQELDRVSGQHSQATSTANACEKELAALRVAKFESEV